LTPFPIDDCSYCSRLHETTSDQAIRKSEPE
jgi:hypothetical protein